MHTTEPDVTKRDPGATASTDNPEIDALLAELEIAQAELARLREEHLREHAELENQRKRQVREVEMSRRFANERLLASLLPVFDSLEAGIAAAHGESASVREGLQLTLRQLTKAATDSGMTTINPLGEVFNPEHHQAIGMTPSSVEHPANSVTQVHQKGYLLNDRLLRPALVMVANSDHD
jgi:molecular chaperone GrpE